MRAIIWPRNAGIPRVLDGSYTYTLNKNGENSLFLFNGRKLTNNKKTIYVSLSGVDTNSGEQSSPLKTIGKALDLMKTSGETGEVILLDEGTYDAPYRNNINYYSNSQWVTIRPRDGLSRSQVTIAFPSLERILDRMRLLKWKNVTFDFNNISQYYDDGEQIAWFDNVVFYDSSGWTGNSNRLVLVRGQYFFTNGESHDILYALPQALLIRNSKIYNISGDVFQNSKMILKSTVDNVDGSVLTHHTDLYQMFGQMDNVILYDITARNLKLAQSIFLQPTYPAGNSRFTMSNSAFVDLRFINEPIYASDGSTIGGPPWSQFQSSFDHILFDNVSLPNQQLIIDEKTEGRDAWGAKNVVFKNSRFIWRTYDRYCQGVSPQGTTFINCESSSGEE